MATVSFDTLEALARRPVASATAASIVSGFARFTEVNGPFKTEWNIYQVGDGDNFTNDDTFVTGLVHPIAASAEWANTDAGAAQDVVSVTLEAVESAAAYRTVTVRDAHDVTAAGLIVKVVGF